MEICTSSSSGSSSSSSSSNSSSSNAKKTNKAVASLESIITIFDFMIKHVFRVPSSSSSSLSSSSSSPSSLSEYLSEYFNNISINSNHSNHSCNLIGSIVNNIIIGNIADNASAYGNYKSSIISTMTILDTLLNAYSIKLYRNDSTNTNGIKDIIDNLDNYYLDFRTR